MKIKKHDYVFIDDGLKYKIYKVVDMKIFIKKCKLNLMFLVNKKYGSTFIYKSKKWIRCKKRKSKLDIDADAEVEGENKNIFYETKSQNLSEENIIELKKMNNDNPYEVVQKIIDNSTSFKEKTQISKFKYVEKKMKRHLIQFTVYECSIVNVINYFYKFFPERVSYIRSDYLANILFHLNKIFPVAQEKLEKEFEHSETDFRKESEPNKNDEQNELSQQIEEVLPCEKQNVIVYDDSCGLLSAILNIFFNYNVNIYSLIHKNCSSSLIPIFGIKKYDNILKINILNFDKTTHKTNKVYLNSKHDIVIHSEHNKEDDNNCVDNDVTKVDEMHINNTSINVLNKDHLESNEGKRKAGATSKNASEIKKRKTYREELQREEMEKEETNKEETNKEETNKEETNKEETITEETETEEAETEETKKENLENEQKKKQNKELDLRNSTDSRKFSETQKILLNEIYQKQAESFIATLSSRFLHESKTNVHSLLETLIKIALKFLKHDSKFILYVDDFVISNVVIKALHTTNSFINIKLNEYILREQQIIKRRTHPIIKTAKLADGFLITATKVAS